LKLFAILIAQFGVEPELRRVVNEIPTPLGWQ